MSINFVAAQCEWNGPSFRGCLSEPCVFRADSDEHGSLGKQFRSRLHVWTGRSSFCVCVQNFRSICSRKLEGYSLPLATDEGRKHSAWMFLCHSTLMLVQQMWCSLNRCSLKLAFRRGLISNRAVLTLCNGAWDSSLQHFLQEQLYAASPKLWMQGKQNKSWLMSY